MTRELCRKAAGTILCVITMALATASSLASPPSPSPVSDGPWTRHVIDNSSRGADGVRLADANGDGLPDIVTGWEESGVTRIYLNPGTGKAAEKWPAVLVGKTSSVEDAVLTDLDGDGAMDVVSCCEGKTRTMFVHWAPKDRQDYLTPQAWRTEAIPASKDRMQWMFCAPVQLDGQGGIDLLAGGKNAGAEVGWWRAPSDPRNLTGWTWHPLCSAGWIMSLVATDMDGDGDPDALVSDRKGKTTGVFWLENPGPGEAQEKPWRRHDIGGQGKEVMFLVQADLDGDGLQDVLAAVKPDEILFLRRIATDGKSWQILPIRLPDGVGTAKSVNVGDIDLDGRMDIVFTCENAEKDKHGAKWLRFRGSPSDADWEARDLSGPEGVKFDLVQLPDLDGDGDLDVLTCEERANLGVFWYENPARRTP